MRMRLSQVTVLLLLASVPALPCAGQSLYQWTNGNITNGTAMLWNDPLNWQSSTGTNFPNAGDTAQLGAADSTPIPSSGTINLNGNTNINTMLLNGSFTLNAVGSTSPNSIQFGVTGNGVEGSGSLSIGGSGLLFMLTGNANASSVTLNLGGAANLSFSSTANAANSHINLNTGAATFYNNSTLGAATVQVSNTSTLSFMNNASAGGAATIASSGAISFNNSSLAGGPSTMITSHGRIDFNNSSSAANATISLVDSFATLHSNSTLNFNNAANAGYANISGNGLISFNSNSTAGFANITVGNQLGFFTSANAGLANITNNGSLGFFDTSSAAASVIVNNGSLGFFDSADGGNASVTNNSGGEIDLSSLNAPGLTLGSVAGAGGINLGANNLTVGTSNTDTAISGTIADGGNGGSLTKTGAGGLTLTGVNTYTGATNIAGGTLALSGDGSVANSSVINLSGGNLDVSAASTFKVGPSQSLMGNGTIIGTLDGATTVVNGTLQPGSAGHAGVLTFTQGLTLGSTAIVNMQIGGLTPGSQYSVLNIAHNLVTGGTLELNLTNNFTVSAGETFGLFNVGGVITNSFSDLILPYIGGLLWDLSSLYTQGDVAVSFPTYAAWVSDTGLTGANALPSARPFSDTLPNAVRYAMNLSTTPAPAQLPSTSVVNNSGANHLVLSYRMRKNMTDYQLVTQSSPDLVHWTDVDAGNVTQLTDADANTAKFQAQAPLPASGVMFLRVVALPSN